jgi:hypothetical protein
MEQRGPATAEVARLATEDEARIKRFGKIGNCKLLQ